MRITTRFAGAKYQLGIGVVIGFTLSICLNEICRRAELSEAITAGSVVSTIARMNSSLHEEIRVLCWVLTCPKNHRTKAIHVKRTWGRRCDKFLFFSSLADSVIESIAVPGVGDNHELLWRKTKFAMKYVWEHHKDEFDWVMKADDDTYVVVENLKKFVSNYSSSDPIFFGCQFRTKEIPPYVHGGAGYVLSKEALRRFVLDALPYPEKCKQDDSGCEDVEMAKCLTGVGVKLEDSRDSWGRHRFSQFVPADHLFPKTLNEHDIWYSQFMIYPQDRGMNCCANDAITFHYISRRDMYVFEYFLYHIRPDGVDREQVYVQEYPLEFPELNSTST